MKKDCFSRNSFSTVWYIPLSRVDFILCLTNDYIAFSVFLLNLHGVKFSKLCMLFLHLTKPQVYPGAISNYHWFQSSLNLFRRDGIIWFNSLLIMNNPLWTINRHFLHMCALVLFLHLICSNWPNWTPKLHWWWWISNFLPTSYKNNFKIQLCTLPVYNRNFSSSESPRCQTFA